MTFQADIRGTMNERRMGRPPKGEKYVELIRATYRLEPGTVKALKKAARRNKLSQSAYIEIALKAQFRKDGIQ
jgi:hypothetical protein